MGFREELLRVVEPTQAEIGCFAIRVFESLREPLVFAIHSEWVDEARLSCTRNGRTRFDFSEPPGNC
jgi:quinol monooxygenase YgiN